MAKQVRRKYNPKGTRREYTHMRVDIQVHEQLQILSKKMELPIVEVLRLAVEKLNNDQESKNE